MSEQQSSRFSNNPNDSNSMQQHDPTANQAQSAPTHCAVQGNAATGVAQGNARNGIAGNAPNATSAMAIAGLVLGLIALLTSFIPIINNLSFFLALLGCKVEPVYIIFLNDRQRASVSPDDVLNLPHI